MYSRVSDYHDRLMTLKTEGYSDRATIYFCQKCGYQMSPDTVHTPRCPDCRSGLSYAYPVEGIRRYQEDEAYRHQFGTVYQWDAPLKD